MGPINYKHLYYFWHVAKQGSIIKASQSLNITPQTISGQISLLEDRLGHQLFLRVGRNLALSETGHIALRYAEEIFGLGKELNDVLRGAAVSGSREFIVSAASALPKTIVHKIIEPCLALAPNLQLRCKEGPVQSILADLAIHEVDVVLSDTPVGSEFSIKAYNHHLGNSPLSFFASPAVAEIYKAGFPNSLHGAPVLLPTKQYAVRQLFDTWAEKLGLVPNIVGEFDDSALMKNFGQSGLGIFFMPSTIAEEVCHGFDVVCLGEVVELTQQFYAISAERKIKHPAIATIVDAARGEIFKGEA